MTFVSKELTAAGLRTHYIEGGTGRPVVLVHGGGAGADAIGNWPTVISQLETRYRIFAPDMVGFGRTEVPRSETYAFSQSERDVHLISFIEALGAGPVTLVGNSMGGLTSLGVAGQRPDLVERLVLMGSAGIPAPLSPQLRSIIEYDFTIQGMKRIIQGLSGPDYVPPAGLAEYRYNLTLNDDNRYAYERILAWQRQNGGLHTTEDNITAVKVPTMVVAGKLDLVVPVSSAYRLLELIPQSWGFFIPSCGHWAMLERPIEFARIVDNFIHNV